MHKRKPALSKGGGTTKLSETLKIQAVDAGFFDGRYLCGAKRAGLDRRSGGRIVSGHKVTFHLLSDGRDNNEQCTSASLPCVKGGGPRSGGRIVSGHKVIFHLLSDDKDNNEQCTRVSLHLLEGEGDRAPTAHGGRGKTLP